MDSPPTYKELEFDNEDFMLDPFNDGEAMTDMSKPINNDQSLANNIYSEDPFKNMHIEQEMSMIKQSSLISDAMVVGSLEEEGNQAPEYAVENYFDEGREHAHSHNYKRANYINDDFVASSTAQHFESGRAQHENS